MVGGLGIGGHDPGDRKPGKQPLAMWADVGHMRPVDQPPLDAWVAIPSAFPAARVHLNASLRDNRISVTFPPDVVAWAAGNPDRGRMLDALGLDAAGGTHGCIMTWAETGRFEDRPVEEDGSVELRTFPCGADVVLTDLQTFIVAQVIQTARPQRWRGVLDAAVQQGTCTSDEGARLRGIQDIVLARGGDWRAVKGTVTAQDLAALAKVGLVKMGTDVPSGQLAHVAIHPDRATRRVAEVLFRNVDMVARLVTTGRIKHVTPPLLAALAKPSVEAMMGLTRAQARVIEGEIPAGVKEATLALEGLRPAVIQEAEILTADGMTVASLSEGLPGEVTMVVTRVVAAKLVHYEGEARSSGRITLPLLDRWVLAAMRMVEAKAGFSFEERGREWRPNGDMAVQLARRDEPGMLDWMGGIWPEG